MNGERAVMACRSSIRPPKRNPNERPDRGAVTSRPCCDAGCGSMFVRLSSPENPAMPFRLRVVSPLVLACLLAGIAPAMAAATDGGGASPFAGDLHWRLLGPFRAGWSTMAEGIPDQPNVFYFVGAGSGVWRTDNAGRTWHSLGDTLPASAMGALAIAPSDPDVIYLGSGQVAARWDIQSGNGVYKSSDGGKSWQHMGLADTKYIGRILVDPKDPDTVLVGALGHYFGPNHERGVFRSSDGGRTWKQTLYIDDDTGVVDLARDPGHPDVIYAAAWQVRNYPWLSYFQPNNGPGSGIYKSVDDGRTWKRLDGKGWPQGNLSRIGLAVAGNGRVYAVIDASAASGNIPHAASRDEGGLYVSDDGGATWTRASGESWLENDYFGRITVDPQVDRRRQDLACLQGRAGRRRLPLRVDQSAASRPHDRGGRSGHHGDGGRRQDVVLLVQPADRAGVPPRGRRPVPVLGVFRPAGFRHHRHRQPQRLWRDQLSRLASGGWRRARLRRARSQRSDDRVRHGAGRAHLALRCAHRAGRQRFSVADHDLRRQARHGEIPLHLDHAVGRDEGQVGQHRTAVRCAGAVPFHRPGRALDRDQPRPDRPAAGREGMRQGHGRERARLRLRRDLFDRGRTARSGRNLDRQ